MSADLTTKIIDIIIHKLKTTSAGLRSRKHENVYNKQRQTK